MQHPSQLFFTLCFADNGYWSVHFLTGLAGASLSNNEMVTTENTPYFSQRQNSTSSTPLNLPLMGTGFAHDFPFGLGLTALYMHDIKAAGTESTFTEGLGPYNTLTHSAQWQRYALMLEPKLAFTRYAIQP